MYYLANTTATIPAEARDFTQETTGGTMHH